MDVELVGTLAKLRLVIGYLGEKENFGWWQSSFFEQGSDAFLSPLFSRTQVLAQCNGVTRAAAIIHDERIGVGNVYHLFRLPEDIEQHIHEVLHKVKLHEIINSKETAIFFLDTFSVKPVQDSLGPTRIGNIRSINDPNSWKVVTGLYLSVFEKNIEIFPYFSDIQ